MTIKNDASKNDGLCAAAYVAGEQEKTNNFVHFISATFRHVTAS